MSTSRLCPKCRNAVQMGVTICPFCHELLVKFPKHDVTRTLSDTDFEEGVPRYGTAHFGTRNHLVLSVRGFTKSFVFDADQITELLVGRTDPDSGESPGVDLQDFDALDKGVSRRHAAVIRKDDKLQIVDRGSPNGTFLNGHRLVAHQPRVLRDGDEVRLGHLVLMVTFERVQTLRDA